MNVILFHENGAQKSKIVKSFLSWLLITPQSLSRFRINAGHNEFWLCWNPQSLYHRCCCWCRGWFHSTSRRLFCSAGFRYLKISRFGRKCFWYHCWSLIQSSFTWSMYNTFLTYTLRRQDSSILTRAGPFLYRRK